MFVLDHTDGYNMMEKEGINNQFQFIQDNIESYPLFEKLLGYQRIMNNLIVSSLSKENDELGDPKYLNISDEQIAEQANSNLFSLNITNLFHSLRPLEQNNIHVCASIIRPIFEAIPKMIYILHHPEDIRIIMIKEEFSIWKPKKDLKCSKKSEPLLSKNDALKKFLTIDIDDQVNEVEIEDDVDKEDFAKRILGNNEIEINDKFFKNFHNKYNNSWYRNQIYSQKQLKLLDVVYGNFSLSSHANINRTRTGIKYNLKDSTNMMKVIIDLSFFNLLVGLNTNHRTLHKIGELENAVNFVKGVQQELQVHLMMTYLYPDHKEYQKKFVLYTKK